MGSLAEALRQLEEAEEAQVGPYLLKKKLGQGSFAPVWLAEESYRGIALRSVALKIFPVPSDPFARPKALEEARTLCRVQHPNVAAFYAVHVDEGRGLLALAMEFVGGRSLAARLAGGKLTLAEAVRVGQAVAGALSAVHEAGLLHRDIKPDNVVEAPSGYKVIDFGIAAGDTAARAPKVERRRVVVDDLPFLVGSGPLPSEGGEEGALRSWGTWGYIDPVCVGTPGEPATVASDLYALGAVLFECLVGVVPAFAPGPGGGRLTGRILDGSAQAPALRSLVPEAPEPLSALVDALLAPERERRPRSAEAVARELSRIGALLSGRKRRLPPEEVGPFRGLLRFESDDRDVFFGRSTEVAAVLERLRSRGLVTLVGPSGSGKSSLARAGVLPAVEEGALGFEAPARPWRVLTATPGADPRASLLAALGPLLPAEGRPEAPDAVGRALAQRVPEDAGGVVLFVDQLEELITLADEEGRRWASGLLVALGERPLPGVRVLATARQDLVERLVSVEGLGPSLLRGAHVVAPLRDAAWGEALEQALGAYGYAFEDEALRGEILAQLRGNLEAMPLVQFALSQLWAQRDVERRLLTRRGLDAIGGVVGALERHADETLGRLDAGGPGLREVARRALLGLTTAQGTRALRPRASLVQELGSSLSGAVLDALERARLVVVEEQGMTLAHEALLTQWGTLRSWVAAVREERMLAEDAESDARRWEASGHEPALLWRGRRLRAARGLREPLSSLAEAFLREGRRLERRGSVALAALGASLMAAALAAGAVYNHNRDEFLAQTQRALLRAERSEQLARQRAAEAEEASRTAEAERRRAAEAERSFREKLAALQAEIQVASAEQLRLIQEKIRKLQGEGGAGQAPTSIPARNSPQSRIGGVPD